MHVPPRSPHPPPIPLPQGAFASRMSHSCTPNCQAVIMACGGRLTIALYTLRHVHEGEAGVGAGNNAGRGGKGFHITMAVQWRLRGSPPVALAR